VSALGAGARTAVLQWSDRPGVCRIHVGAARFLCAAFIIRRDFNWPTCRSNTARGSLPSGAPTRTIPLC
jgi:hypothetical protein